MKETISSKEYSSISKTLTSASEPFTLHPHPDSIRFVVEKLLSKFPVLVIEQENETTTMVKSLFISVWWNVQ